MIEKSEKLASQIVDYIKRSLPVVADNGMTMTIDNIKVTIPENNYDIDTQLSMKCTGKGNTEGYISGTVKIKNSVGAPVYSGHYKTLVTFPVVTERGTYIVNGVEKNIISQMRMKAGCYSNKTSTGDIKTQLRFERNSRSGVYMPAISIILNPITKVFNVEIKSYSKIHKINVLNFMQLLGFTEGEIRQSLGNSILVDSIMEANSKKRNERTLDYLYKIFFPKASSGIGLTDTQRRQEILSFFTNNASFGDGSVVATTLNMSKNNTFLNKEVIQKAIKKTVSVCSGLVNEDVKDDIKFKEIYNDTDLIYESITEGLDNFLNSVTLKLNSEKSETNGVTALSQMQKLIEEPLKNSKTGLMNSELCISSEEINPLFMEAKQREITQGGPDGMSKNSMRNETEARNLTQSGINKIDPIETPESGKIGFTQHLTTGAIIEDHTIKSEYYKVSNGEAIIDDKNIVRLSPLEEEKNIIAFNDSRYLIRDGNKLTFSEDIVPGRYLGKKGTFPKNKIQYVDAKSTSVLGTSANMTPFVSHNDGARALMGASMQKQSINLVNRQAPMVTTLADKQTGLTFDQKVGEENGKPVRCLADGVVNSISNSKIIVVGTDGKEYSHPYYNYFPLNQSYINNELKVSVGDKVTKGQILAEGWQTKDGKLAQGVNGRIAYMPYKGFNYEDGLLVSKSFAKLASSEEYEQYEVYIPKDVIGGRGSKNKRELMKYTTSANLQLFDDDGIAKVGQKVKGGSMLVGCLKEINTDSDDLLDLLTLSHEKKSYKYKEYGIEHGSYVEGVIKRIDVVQNPDAGNKQKIIFSIVTQKPLKFGDKIAGRHGNKGTITKVLDDELMPIGEDGKRIDIIMSPLAVPSRKNPGQLLEVGAGLVAEKTGKRFVVDNFNHKEKDRVLEELKKIGFPDGKMKVTLKEEDERGKIIDVPCENPVTVGNLYIIKLKQKVDDKVQARSNFETPLQEKTHMPMKQVGTAAGEKSNPQRHGEMEMRALQGHGAVWNLLENATIKADGGGDAKGKAAIFNAIATGRIDSDELEKTATPETVNVLIDNLKVLGLDVKPMYGDKKVDTKKPFNSLGIAPLNQEEFLKTIGKDKEVTNFGQYQARQFYGDKDSKTDSRNKAKQEFKGGLLDSDIFGDGEDEEDRTKWGYVKLPMPVPNPIFMEDASNNVYSELTGLKKDELKQLAAPSSNKGDKAPLAVITEPEMLYSSLNKIENKELSKFYKEKIKKDMEENGFHPGDLVSADILDKLKKDGINIPFKTGGDALDYLLCKVDIDKSLDVAKSELEKAKKAPDINKAFKKIKTIEMLKNNNLKPSDLMVRIVPVTPTYLRPIVPDKENKGVQVSDLNRLYEKIINAKTNAEKEVELNEDGTINQNGLSPNDVAQRSKMLYDSLKMLHGNTTAKYKDKELVSMKDTLGSKKGIIRKEMLAKREDFSGRSVITVDPDLKLNEVGLPLDMAKQLYRPFIERELIDSGECKNKSEVKERLKNPDSTVKKIIQDIATDRPLFLNRQPSLHKLSEQAMVPKIKEKEGNTVIRSLQLNPLVVTGFNADFDGDTMAAHVPVTERAKEEAKRIAMPSQNLINPTDGKMVIEIRHEMVLGIYQITKDWNKPQGKTKTYQDYKTLFNDYILGRIPHNQKVKVPICSFETTAGQALFNWILPERISKFRDFRKPWNKGEISKLLMKIYEFAESSDFKSFSKIEIANLMDKMKDLGLKASTRNALSLGVKDFTFDDNISKEIAKITESNDSDDIDAWRETEKKIEDKLKSGLLPDDNPLQVMMLSGARANAQQIRKMFSNIGVGMDVDRNLLSPIKKSHFDGLSPQDYYTLGMDSRKGIYDRSVSTEKPGALTRDVWAATQDIVVTEKDCKTKDFINIKKTDKTIKGRFAGKDILGESGKILAKRNQMITTEIYEKIYKDETIEYVPVRSPLRCKTPNGKCQMCYGAMPGTNQIVKIGTAIGVIASQSIGEPVTQMTMNTFHTGGANSSATLGLPRIKSILDLGKDVKNNACLAEKSGFVTSIKETENDITIYIDKKKHVITKIPGQQAPKLKVKEGDVVSKGDFLTVGDLNDTMVAIDNPGGVMLTNADPKKMFKLKSEAEGQEKAINYTKDYLANSMQYAIKASNAYMDRRHSETIVSKLTGTAMITDSGDSPYMKGQRADVNLFDKWNRENCTNSSAIEISQQNFSQLAGRILAMDIIANGKTVIAKGQVITPQQAQILSKYPIKIKVRKRPIEYEIMLSGKDTAGLSQEDWFSNLGGRGGIMKQLSQGAAMGAKDNLNTPRAQLMAGKMLSVGEGANYTDDFRNKFTSKMSNFFNNKINVNKYKK